MSPWLVGFKWRDHCSCECDGAHRRHPTPSSFCGESTAVANTNTWIMKVLCISGSKPLRSFAGSAHGTTADDEIAYMN